MTLRPLRSTLSSGMSRTHIHIIIYSNKYNRPDGSKKAFARLTADVDALDIAATKLAIV